MSRRLLQRDNDFGIRRAKHRLVKPMTIGAEKDLTDEADRNLARKQAGALRL